MTKLTRLLLFGLLTALLVVLPTACEENLYDEDNAVDWAALNARAFEAKLKEARTAVAAAKAEYGADWEAHCDWRVFRTYAQSEEVPGKSTDSICVQILERGTGSGSPLYTDSVRVNYLGRLVSTDAAEPIGTPGEVFDHSGLTQDYESIFSPQFSRPTMFRVSNLVEGFTTALMRMRIGDLWRVYIPNELGYGGNSTTSLPAYSTLIFDMQLKAYYRAGTQPGPWK